MASEDAIRICLDIDMSVFMIGNGKGEQNRGGCMVHNPGYDFNDAIIPLGVKYWVALAQALMPEDAADTAQPS